ncbi:hypothetical protein VTN77DRAFT_206 [Rasamsonia byssochlamydoides]|uniref:uncharacterized protein n=1 Tax=Rasamsonia byssochlamydoides TaxID=89139 RepID=UPI003744B061
MSIKRLSQRQQAAILPSVPACSKLSKVVSMPRRDFLKDLKRACSPGWFPRLSDVRAGEDDGSICFTYTGSGSCVSIDFQALVSDLSQYPNHHEYFVFSTSENVPSAVASSLEEVQPQLAGSSVIDFLSTLSDVVENVLSPDQSPHSNENDKTPKVYNDVLSDDGTDWGFFPIQGHDICERQSDDDELLISPTGNESELKAKLRRDLRAAKIAGFKVGYLGDLAGSVIVSISCRISKLGISNEAMQAWSVDPWQYLVLLIRYPRNYLDFDEILQEESRGAKLFVQMHVGLCDSYKPSLASALQAFVPSANPLRDQQVLSPGTNDSRKLALPLFIEGPLRTLLNERFVKIVSYRYTFGFSWAGAELYFNDSQGKILDEGEIAKDEYSAPEDWGSSAPRFLATDHMSDTLPPARLSFPLLAMQFTLRHFVKCTEFCLICHCKIDAGFEALKPYVCSKPLCLYQYMALGMGPSLEWEILSQPYVVDLLVSFTYSSAAGFRLNDFPIGLGLKVPAGAECFRDFNHATQNDLISACFGPSNIRAPGSHTAKLDATKMELILPKSDSGPSLRPGDWIVIIAREVAGKVQSRTHWHCHVKSTEDWPYVQLSSPVIRGTVPDKQQNQEGPQGGNQIQSVVFIVYDRNFDSLNEEDKRKAITMLLDTLPDVDAMKAYLRGDRNDCSERLLSSWKDRISGSALDVLRWIVASNRSCIMHDDDGNSASNDNLVSGMEGYMQFRLAQGAPDKEQRFVDSVNSTVSRLNLKYPTLFAWHGSPLNNWHGILREGLHFKEIHHGRSYGNGVYMSSRFLVSSGYCKPARTWPNSKLKISMAISLNEVVNAPGEFVCSSPFVVRQLDWIQPRYLFVKCQAAGNGGISLQSKKSPSAVYTQDPKHPVHGPRDGKIDIPITALSQRRRETCEVSTVTKKSPTSTPTKSKKRKSGSKTATQDEDTASVETNHEDLLVLLSDTEVNRREEEYEEDADDEMDRTVKTTKGKFPKLLLSRKKKTAAADTTPKTDFKPGTLSESSLKLLAPPAYATSMATKTLQQHFQATLKVQNTQPLHELGWYIDPNLITTVYQWIVELHTFDPSLPLAKDLKAAGLHSVVLEMRFPKDFPMSPPFVRVIRPRFLEFQRGGGGHVTAGGALCMELLTNTGWSPALSIESVLLQVRLALSSTDPQPARLKKGQGQSPKKGKGGEGGGEVMEYSVAEAVDAYRRACNAHGWEIPKDFQCMLWA